MRYIDDEESAITLTPYIRVSNTVDGIMFLRSKKMYVVEEKEKS